MKAVFLMAMLVLPFGCASPERQLILEEPVRALRYPMLIVEGALDSAHGGGEWVDTLFIPEFGIVFRVLWQSNVGVNEKGQYTIERTPRLHTAFSTMDEERKANPADEAGSGVEPVEVAIPASLAREILRIAEMTRARDRAGSSAARKLVENKFVRPPRARFTGPQ